MWKWLPRDVRECSVRGFFDIADVKRRLVSVGRYARRGVSHPEELFTIDPEA
jgi:hypothetical protein